MIYYISSNTTLFEILFKYGYSHDLLFANKFYWNLQFLLDELLYDTYTLSNEIISHIFTTDNISLHLFEIITKKYIFTKDDFKNAIKSFFPSRFITYMINQCNFLIDNELIEYCIIHNKKIVSTIQNIYKHQQLIINIYKKELTTIER